MKPGIYYDVPSHEYHTGPGVSKSGLDLLRISPEHYADKYLRNLPSDAGDGDDDLDDAPTSAASFRQLDDDDTEAKLYGRALHALMLEPEVFERDFVVQPRFGLSKVEKEAKAAWKAAHSHCEIVTARQVEDMIRMRDAIRAHRVASRLFSLPNSRGEVSAYWNDPTTGVLCRVRGDLVVFDREMIIDIKVIGRQRANKAGFERLSLERRWYVGSAFYADGFRANGMRNPKMVYVLVERRKNPKVGVYVQDPDDVGIGRDEYIEDLQLYAQCKAADHWPGYCEKIEVGRLPAWRRRQAGIE